MKRALGLLVVLGWIATPAVAQRINIDYDENFDFATVRTFQYHDTPDTNIDNPLMDARAREAIVREMTEGGLEHVDSNPDLYITYHVTTQDYVSLTTTTHGYGGWGRGWHRWGGGMTSSSTTATTYTEGTMIIDAYKASDKQMVWRGTGTVTVKAKPEKQTKQIDKILAKMGKRWEKILAKQGK
jgi:hypothetical protein